jgi:uncharacterized protein YjbI with pentapeptide repeats
MRRLCHLRTFRASMRTACFAATSACFLAHGSFAASDAVVANAAPVQSTLERKAIEACIAIARPDTKDLDISAIAERLQKPDNRIDGQDWSKQDLSGRDLRGKVLANVKLKGANLHGADLVNAIICGSDLTEADFTGAHLDGALVGGDTELDGANFTEASARGIIIANATGSIRIDRADWRGANIFCDDLPLCLGSGVAFSSIAGADLRGATVDGLCCALSGLDSARLDGTTTVLLNNLDTVSSQLAAGVGEPGRITLLPAYGQSGMRTEFTGQELRQLAAIIPQMQSASAHPSFDCARAGTNVEKAVCADPKLAALDRALNWLWQDVEHTPQELTTQKKWADSRANCPPSDYVLSPDPLWLFSFGSPGDPRGCIGIAYAKRIGELGLKSHSVFVGNGTYTTDPPLELPKGSSSAMARKFLMARGYREDEIILENFGKGAGKVAGDGLWGNGHLCGFEASENKTQRTGLAFRINDEAPIPDEKYSVSFVITPQVIVRVGGAKQFQCGARGGWSDAYFRQPDDLISSAKKLAGIH